MQARRGARRCQRAAAYGGTELTEAGEKAAADFKREDNPRFRCETTSIVFDWTFDGPVEPDHAEQRHDRAGVRTVRIETHDLHEPEGTPDAT